MLTLVLMFQWEQVLQLGWTDGSLFMAGQMNSFPNIIAGVMSMAGGGEFTQPYVSDNVGGILVGGAEFGGKTIF